MLAKIGVTPIFAGWCSNEQFSCNTDVYYQPVFTCLETGTSAYIDSEYGKTGCPDTTKQVCYQKCGSTIDKKTEYTYSCCRNKSAKEICEDRDIFVSVILIGKTTQTAYYWSNLTDNTQCPRYGNIIATDLQADGLYGMCCDLGFTDDIDFYDHCEKIGKDSGYYTYAKTGAYAAIFCDSGYNLVGSRLNYYTLYINKDICCMSESKTDELSIEEKCSKIEGGYLSTLDSDGDGNIDCYKSTTDEIVISEEEQICCKPKKSSSEETSEEDLSLNVNTTHLKFQSLLDVNPLQNSSVFSDPDSRTPGNIINQALTAVVFPIAGVGLIILILWGGFQVLSGSLSGKQNNIDLGKKRVTAAVVGFILLFLIYWIWRLIALATGLSV